MRTRATLIVLGAVGTVLYSVTILPGQTASSAYRASRTADGKPKLEGIWQAMNTANWNIEAHEAAPPAIPELGASGAVPAGLGIVVDGPVPYKPEALAKKKANGADWLKLDPEVKCYLPGVPRAMYQPFAFQIVQSPKHIMFAYEFADAVRTVYMTDQVEAPADSWMGWSNGKWDGDTLVIDTTGFNGKAWFDRAGNFASDQLHVVERISARSADTLNYEATMDDPQTFTRPWKISMPLYRHVEKNAQLAEFRCVEFAEDVVYGAVNKPKPK
jgi:hypothetical protein